MLQGCQAGLGSELHLGHERAVVEVAEWLRGGMQEEQVGELRTRWGSTGGELQTKGEQYFPCEAPGDFIKR